MLTRAPLLFPALLAFSSIIAWADSASLGVASLKTLPSTSISGMRLSTLRASRSSREFRRAKHAGAFRYRSLNFLVQNDDASSPQLSRDNSILNISVPEPSSLAMLSTGLVAMAYFVNRRRHTSRL